MFNCVSICYKIEHFKIWFEMYETLSDSYYILALNDLFISSIPKKIPYKLENCQLSVLYQLSNTTSPAKLEQSEQYQFSNSNSPKGCVINLFTGDGSFLLYFYEYWADIFTKLSQKLYFTTIFHIITQKKNQCVHFQQISH